MRFSGQGLMSHTATTTITRYFTKSRGKALSAGWFGLSTAEFILPVLIVYLLTITAWQNIWISISILILIFLPITSFLLIKRLDFDTREQANTHEFEKKEIKQWRRIEVIKDYRFYVVCLNMLAMPWIATGVFVYQSFITEAKGWGSFVIAQSFMAYSILSVVTLLGSGFLIDKFTSRKLLIFMNIPLTTALMVFSTAFGTALFGFLIDKGFSIELIAMISFIYILISLILLIFVRNKLNPHYI